MKGQLRQVIFLAIFGVLCSVFVFFVPWGSEETSGAVEESPELTGTLALGDKEEDLNFAFTGKLLLLTDEKVKNADFVSFLSDFQKQFGFEVEVKTKLSPGQQADVFLLPYDQLVLSGDALKFSQDLKPYFLTGLSEILNQSGFIPYAIDPLVLYTLPKKEEKSDFITDFLSRSPQKPSASFLFGPYQDERLKSQNLAFALMLNDFVKYNDYGAFEQWNAMLASPELRNASFHLFEKIAECKDQPLFCLVKKGFLQWGIGFASELYEQQDFQLYPYPYQYEGLPVRVYGFSVNSHSEHRAAVEQLISAFLTSSDETVRSLMQKSGFSSVFSSLAEQNCGIGCDFSLGIKVIEQSEQKVQALFGDFLFKKLEEKKLKPDLYLQRASVY